MPIINLRESHLHFVGREKVKLPQTNFANMMFKKYGVNCILE